MAAIQALLAVRGNWLIPTGGASAAAPAMIVIVVAALEKMGSSLAIALFPAVRRPCSSPIKMSLLCVLGQSSYAMRAAGDAAAIGCAMRCGFWRRSRCRKILTLKK